MVFSPLHRPLTLLVSLGAVALLFVTWSKVVTTLSNANPVAPKSQPSAIVWADRVFGNPAALRRWLHSRGVSYEAWSAHHPQQAAIIEHRPVAQTVTVVAGAKPKPRSATRVTATRRQTSATTGGAVIRDIVFTVLLLLALVLAAAAALPAPLRRRFPAIAFRVAHYRGAFAAAAAAIVLGIAVGVGLG